MILHKPSGGNLCAFTLWENRLEEATTFTLTITSDFDSSIVVTQTLDDDQSINPRRFNLYFVADDDALVEGWHTYTVTQVLQDSSTHLVEQGRIWVSEEVD